MGELLIDGDRHPLWETVVSQSPVGAPPVQRLPALEPRWVMIGNGQEARSIEKYCSPPQQPPSKRWERVLPAPFTSKQQLQRLVLA